MKSKYLLITVFLLTSTIVRAQSTKYVIRPFLSESLQSPDVVTYQIQQFLMAHAPKLPHPASAAQWTAKEKQIRNHVLNDVIYHGWPKSWVEAAPKFQDMGVVSVPHGAGYRIRKFRYEVVPGFYSTAVLYEPEHLHGQAPAVLDVLGHFGTGKSSPFEQKLCINQALRGMIALSIAFIDQGELRVNGNEHYFGSDLDLVGVSGVGLFYLAMRRGLDYLYDDPHVDRSRIAVTGLSGGGWQTIMLSSMDPRVKVSIPVAGFTSLKGRFERLPHEPGDYEQLAPNLLEGQGYQTFAAMLAPRPTLEINNAEDSCCFRAPLVKPDIYEAIKPFFRLYGKQNALQFHSDTQVSEHNYQRDNRQHAYRFLDTYFHLSPKPEEIPVGQYLKSFNELASGIPVNNLTILGLARQFASQVHHGPIPIPGAERASWAQTERRKLRTVVHYQPVEVTHPWYVADTNDNTIESISFRFSMSNGLSATGVWAKSISTPPGAPLAIVVDDSGHKGAAREGWEHYPIVAYQIDRDEQVLVLSVLFTGDDNPAPENVDSTGYMLTAVGAPPLGLEAAQLIGITKWAEQKWHPSRIDLESIRYRMQVVSLVAGALEPHLFKHIVVFKGVHSLNYILDKPVHSTDVPDMFCQDFYKDFDLDMLRAMAQPTSVTQASYIAANTHN